MAEQQPVAERHTARARDEALVDPGIEIIIAVVGLVGGAITIVDRVDRHFYQLPSRVRARILRHTRALENELRLIRQELSRIEEVFARTHDPDSVLVRLGNGYLMPRSDFEEYASINQRLMRRLRSLSRNTFRLERGLAGVADMDPMQVGKEASGARDALLPILTTQDLTLPDARARLQGAIGDLSSLCERLRGRVD